MFIVVALLLLITFVVAALVYVSLYNRLVTAANRVDQRWADIDTQLKRRADLIPNFVETVKGYAAHEKETLDAVITARNASATAATPAQAAAADSALTGSLGRLFALAESYPQLRANENFLQLQTELAVTENMVAGVRQQYNTAVQELNTLREVFPSNLVAGSKPRFASREYFEVADPDSRDAPKIEF